MKRNLTNHQCIPYAAKQQEFSNKLGSIFGRDIIWWDSDNPDGQKVTFTVYSYGSHFPMYVYDYETCRWYGNSGKASRTTSKHQTLMRPTIVEQWFSTVELTRISQRGIVKTIERRLAT